MLLCPFMYRKLFASLGRTVSTVYGLLYHTVQIIERNQGYQITQNSSENETLKKVSMLCILLTMLESSECALQSLS